MFIDSENSFTTGGTSGQSLASGFGVGTTALGNVIDLGPLSGQNSPNANAGRDMGGGYPMWLYFLWVTGVAPTTGTVDIQLVTSAAASLSSPNVILDLTGGAVAGTSSKLATGNALKFLMPRAGIGGTTGYLRYLGINMIVATSALTGGLVQCYMVRDLQDNLLYQAGYTIQ